MNLQDIGPFVKEYSTLLIIIAVVALGGLVSLVNRFGTYAWYFIVLVVVFVAAVVSQNLLYFYAFLLGVVTAFAEIIGKFSDDPIKALGTNQALFYHLLNGVIAALALKVIFLYGVASSTPLDQLKIVLVAGLGSMLVMRSKLFDLKVGGQDVAFGPDQIIKVFFRFMEQAIDRVRARSRIELVKKTMDNIDFVKVYEYSLTMLGSVHLLSVTEKQELRTEIEKIRDEEPEESQLKSYRLGFLLLHKMGEDFVSEIFENPPIDWQARAPIEVAKEEGFLSRIPFWTPKEAVVHYFAYGASMSTQIMSKRLGWPDSESRFLDAVTPKKCVLKDYHLVFNKPAREDPLKQGFANIMPEQNGTVEGVLYRLPKAALGFLDKYEGGYRLVTVTVMVNGKQVRSQAYVAQSPVDGLKPRKEYLDVIHNAAREHNLSEDYIQTLESTGTLSSSAAAQ